MSSSALAAGGDGTAPGSPTDVRQLLSLLADLCRQLELKLFAEPGARAWLAVELQRTRALESFADASQVSEALSATGTDGYVTQGPEVRALFSQASIRLTSVWDELSERDRRLLSSRFGLDDDAGERPLSQVAVHLSLSAQRARQIEQTALAKLGRLLGVARQRREEERSASW